MSLPITFREALANQAGAAEPRVLAGMWICSGSTVAAEICAGAGLDWVLIDMEHCPNGLQSVLTQLQTVAAYPVTSVVRVPTNDAVVIKQVLDLGAQTLLVPMVSSAQEARAAVRATRYPPHGVRGVGSALARSARWNRVDGYLAHGAEHVSVIVQIETDAGVKAVDEIAAVDGVDGVFVGPSDLSASMGLIGQQTHPDVVAALHATFDAVQAAGKPVGVNAFDPATAEAYIKAGAKFILVGADVAILARGSEQLAARFVSGADARDRASY